MENRNPNMAETANARGQVYALLARVFRAEPSSAFLEELKGPRFAGAFASLQADLGEDFEKLDQQDLSEHLGLEFTRLFMGPGVHVSPHESVFTEVDGESGGLYGAQTVRVKKFIETTGLSYDEDFSGLPDHVSVELEFMSKLADTESQNWSKGNEKGAKYCLSVQKLFAEQHLLKWLPEFTHSVSKKAKLPFYREMARIARDFVDFDFQSIRESLA